MYIYTISKPKKGFTLAEVLLTLTIIGVIASLTIPNLIQRINEQEYNIGAKAVFSVLSQGLKLMETKNEGVVHVGTIDSYNDYGLLLNDFCSVMSCIKIDNTYNIFGPTKYKFYKGGSSTFPTNTSTVPGAILNNGMYLRFTSYENCTYYGLNVCGSVAVDTNGAKGPNMDGMDFLFFNIVLKNGVYTIIPRGVPGDTSYGIDKTPSGCTNPATGWSTSNGCAYQRLMNPDNMP